MELARPYLYEMEGSLARVLKLAGSLGREQRRPRSSPFGVRNAKCIVETRGDCMARPWAGLRLNARGLHRDATHMRVTKAKIRHVNAGGPGTV